MDKSQKKSTAVFILIIMLAFLIGRNQIYTGNLEKIVVLKKQIKEEKKINEILEETSILEKKLQLHQRRSFPAADPTQLINKISQFAKEANINIGTFDSLSPIDKARYIELPLKMPFSCSYHQLGKFLSLIESNQGTIWVKRLNIEKTSATTPEEERMLKVELTLSGIYLKK